MAIAAKPEIPPWIPPPETKEDLDWASLKTLDLSKLDSEDPKDIEQLLDDTRHAIKEDGFLYLTHYGIPLEKLHRQFAIAQHLLDGNVITEEEKKRLEIQQHTGSYAGYKPMKGWGAGNGSYDGIENFTFYSPEMENPDKRPKGLEPFMDEVKEFWTYAHDEVNRKLLKLLSRVLELPDDYLWDNVQSHDGEVCAEGYFRFVCYRPMEKGQEGASMRIHGHHDIGTTTLLFSVPISALQVWNSKAEKWQWVKYKPGALVINLGESLEILTGGHFVATKHRVVSPPSDQQHLPRLSCAMFCSARGDLKVSPLQDSPMIQREGLKKEGVYGEFAKLLDAGMDVPDHDTWRKARRAYAQQGPSKQVTINKIKYSEEIFNGIKVYVPV
ncbi:uncharacterized protein I303_106335 [Kwoniella dejecticola CBS 10117]|uniref:Fe2OG dioxygenase domain-containing protein n=1 Tax=Kwoniella dejecticola CBS 10117 TaxID=1296121 RepID=A0A1A5ZUZ9_9TREE|nr:uncharacterized protein I303_08408 [Kwoniella dejecticola CBS 10117]OBR81637.1 hypothetical protein I303_08408 [Kwoniella dejecticola CBS 10117]